MPRSTLVNAMKTSAAALRVRSESNEASSPIRPSDTIPALPELEPMLGPEGLESWDTDWRNIVTMVSHGLTLFEHFEAILAAHQREERTPQDAPAADPRERAQQLIAALERYQQRYQPVLHALARWQQDVERLRRFQLTTVPALAWARLRVSVDDALRKMRHPAIELSAIPPLPAPPASDDEEALEHALDLLRQVRATLTEHANAPRAAAQAIFAVRDCIGKVADIIREEDGLLSTVAASHGLTTVPSIMPVLDVRAAIPAGWREPPDTSALGHHDQWCLP